MMPQWQPESEMLESLVQAVPDILASQKPNGQFGTEPWIATDQNALLPLAAAWHLPESAHHHSDEVLGAIVRGGDALIDAQDESGMWIFRKKDRSTWGPIYQPWTYSRWIRAFLLTRDAMPAAARDRWTKALRLGFDGIARTAMRHFANIPTHHAMALYCAAGAFGRDDWKAQAVEFIHKIVERQSPHGWWSEHVGPVVTYNFVYSEALGVYYSFSGDERVLEALARAARFHANYTYPDGSTVETVDERNPYSLRARLGNPSQAPGLSAHPGTYSQRARLGNPGFSHTPVGRGYLAAQHAIHLKTGEPFPADYAANMLLHAGHGPAEPPAGERDRHAFRMDDEAMIVRRRPWFLSLSAFACEVSTSRWIQDRQNHVSVFHDRTGLIVGGGNTKLQPLWSTFTVGDASLLKHAPGDEDPNFAPEVDLLHVPDAAAVARDADAPTLDLTYGEHKCGVALAFRSDTELKLIYRATADAGKCVEAHVTLLPRVGRPVRFASGREVTLGEDPWQHVASDDGWIEHAGWRLSWPAGARLVWPALPHNPYRKGGESTIEEARLVLALPFGPQRNRHELTLEVL